MADGRPRSQTHTETWQDQDPPPNTNIVYLISSDAARVPSQRFSHTSQETLVDASPWVIQQSTSGHTSFPNEPLSESNLHRLDNHNKNHDSYRSGDETSAMVHSPEGSSPKHLSAKGSPQARPRVVTYASSASSPPSNRKPLRQDSAYFSSGGPHGDGDSDGDSDTKEQQLRARERVVILRRKVLKTRQVKRTKRDNLRHLREKVRSILDRLNQKINELVALNKIPEEIGRYYEELRAAQDELGPAEHEYERLESRLDDEEEDLEEEEENLYELYQCGNVFEVSNQGSRLEQTISPATKPYEFPNTEIQPLSIENDLLQEYLSKIDEALGYRTELQNLEDDYVRVSEEANIRRRNGFPLFATMIAFLSDYPKSRAEILEILYRAEDELFDLREECLKQGLFAKDEYLYEPRDALRDDLMEAVEEALERSPLRVAAQHLKRVGVTKEGSKKKDDVNKWLLHWVQDSTVDMMMLRTFIYGACPGIFSAPNKTLVEIGDDKWTDCSLANWFTDSAGKSADVFYNANRYDEISGATNKLNSTNWSLSTGSSLNVGLDFDRITDPVIMGSEAASYTTQKEDLDTTPTKSNVDSGTVTPAAFKINVFPYPPIRDSNITSASASQSKPANLAIQIPPTEMPPPTFSYGSELPLPRFYDSEDHLSPNTTSFTSRSPSFRSNSDTFSTSQGPSLHSARTSIGTMELPLPKPLLSSLSKQENPEPPVFRSAFLDTPEPTLSRSSSLSAPKRPAHHLARRSLHLMTGTNATLQVPSHHSAATSVGTDDSIISKPITPPNPDPSEAQKSKSEFLDTPKASLHRSSSLNSPKRPAHHVARRSLDMMTGTFTTHNIRKSASFTNY